MSVYSRFRQDAGCCWVLIQHNVRGLMGMGETDGNSVSAFPVATFLTSLIFSPHYILKAIIPSNLSNITHDLLHSADNDSPPSPPPTSQCYKYNIFLYHVQPLSFETRNSHPRLGKYLSQGQGSIPTIQSAHCKTTP